MGDQLDLRAYWRILLRWWWLLALGVVGAAVATFFLSRAMTPIYEATAKVLVQGGATPGTPSLSDLQASQQLARNYGDLIKTRPILEQVIEELSLSEGSGALSDKITVTNPRSLIEVKVADPDPNLAAELANTIAQTFMSDYRDKQFLQIAQFQTSLAQYGITQDPSIIAAQAATMGTLRMAEPAVPPSSPSSPRTISNMILGALLGLLVAALAVFVLEYLDDRIKSPEDLKALTGLATLGSVLRYRTGDGKIPVTLSDEHLRSVMAESYKFLRTNLQFAALGTQGFKTLLITSSSPEEGKTTTAANLAVSLASEGKSVILVDSDLRKPALHRVFDLPEHKGLTHLILGDATLDEVMSPTSIEGLRVISSGPVPPDATYVLGSPKMKEVVEEIKNSADIVIFDSPPILVVADPMLLGGLVDGVLMVVNSERTRQDTVKHSVENLRQAAPAFMGAVLNKVSTKGRGGYYYYYYSSYYGEDGQERQSRRSRLFGKVFRKKRRRQ